MSKKIFVPADILLPNGVDMEKWSVIACDQFTSEPEYWKEVANVVGDAPSTLGMMLPEAYLDHDNTDKAIAEVNETMRRNLENGVFRTLRESFVYVERRLANGAVRHGLIGAIDLDSYDYKGGKNAFVYPTEGTVEERLPPRVKVRQNAALEMPHIIVFIDDPDRTVIEPIADGLDASGKIYDFDLMCGGGHITGWQVAGERADRAEIALQALADPETLARKYGEGTDVPMVFAVGDGNHSLATAKRCWENIKSGLTDEEKQRHPARYGLVELVNLHDESIVFEPIHRAVFGVDPEHFAAEAEMFLTGRSRSGQDAHTIRCITGKTDKKILISGLSIGELIGAAEEFCQAYISQNGGRIDYIHGDDTAAALGAGDRNASLLLPPMEKTELFRSIIKSGVFPRKSFSIGHARDKRYYLECRMIAG